MANQLGEMVGTLLLLKKEDIGSKSFLTRECAHAQ